MCQEFSCKRPLYTNNEIVHMFKTKFEENEDEIEGVAKKYNVDGKIISLMMDRTCHYNYEMLKIASDYIGIDYNEMVSFIYDDDVSCSLRADSTEEANELNDILNYLFDEMINQERLALV
ncbi:hypothetical protein [Clostridium baratii]|uniref:hypothetical protein n=1 Tax=Clostridium baratii TaxID=1561 RepID=UPI003D350138